MTVVTDAIKSHASKGGGSRYGKQNEVKDLTIDSATDCRCYWHRMLESL